MLENLRLKRPRTLVLVRAEANSDHFCVNKLDGSLTSSSKLMQFVPPNEQGLSCCMLENLKLKRLGTLILWWWPGAVILQWPGAFCSRGCCFARNLPPPVARFGIHGLWPAHFGGMSPCYCSSYQGSWKAHALPLLFLVCY